MSYELLAAMAPQLLTDLASLNPAGGSPSTNGINGKHDEVSRLVLAPIGEDLDARLRSIRHNVTPKELAALLRCHVTTVYRMVDAGLPVEYGVDPQVGGRPIRIYPPQFADWRREPRDTRKAVKSKRPRPSIGTSLKKRISNAEKVVELSSDAELNARGLQHCPPNSKDQRL